MSNEPRRRPGEPGYFPGEPWEDPAYDWFRKLNAQAMENKACIECGEEIIRGEPGSLIGLCPSCCQKWLEANPNAASLSSQHDKTPDDDEEEA